MEIKAKNYVVTTIDYVAGGIMVEVLPTGADVTLPNYGNVQRFRAANGESWHAWSLVSGQSGIQRTEDQAVKAVARAIWRKR